MKKLLPLILIFVALHAKASHIVGGDIYYDYVGGNNYKFYITLYRDCNSTGAQYDNPLNLAVYNKDNFLIQNVAVPFPGSVILPVVFNNPCVTPPSNICVEKAVYTTVINLPPTIQGYTITYQRCCRGPNITNLNSPDNTGLTLTSTVPGSETGFTINSSPRFTNYPPLLLCNNDDLIFNHVATDPDGDQLVYSLVAPYSGASSGNPAPNPSPPPPYFPVNFAGGFNAANPLGPGATISINPTTGLLTASPQMLGLFVVGIRVQEYRNGVLIGQTVRDFLFKVFNCNISMQAILPTQEQLPTFVSYCQGLNVQFQNNSFGGTNYQWDFGVPGITTDVSTSFAPSYTYPAPGTYQVTLVVNPGWPCTDTATMQVKVNNPLNVSYHTIDSICVIGNSFDFTALSNGPAGTTFDWTFGPNASQATATGSSVNNVSFTSSGWIPITIKATSQDCSTTHTSPIYIFSEPTADIELPVGYECEGLTVTFGNNSIESSNYQWDFGVPGITTDVSSAFEPTYTFPAGGTYTVTLISRSTNACSDTTTVTITVNELLTIDFSHNDSLCITNNSFNFDGTMTGPTFTQYLWSFGQNANPTSATTLDVNDVQFSVPGTIPITLKAYFDNCSKTVTKSIFIYREPTVDFRVEPGDRCVPATVQFTDLSVADSPMTYLWDFGDGATSTLQNPSHQYQNPGMYTVSLSIQTNKGCIAQLTEVKQDVITIHPTPVSAFMVDPKQTDICHAEITFTDQSQGASSIFYWFNDSTFTGNQANMTYNYTTSGWKRPMQVATNQWGCKDTSYQELYIEPFVIYFPNSFTPDGNEFNNIFNGQFALEVIEWRLRIYNRWGEMLFESFDPAFGWDGYYQSLSMQDGTYAYVLHYTSCEKPNETQIITGHVNLLK